MSHGRKITLHLVEGKAGGIIRGELGNWIGLVTKAPRTKLKDLVEDDAIKQPGVYILTGPDPEDIATNRVYIGESENVFKRLKQHERDNDKVFFDGIAVVTSANANLTKAHILYLESRLIQIARDTKRASVHNGNSPDLPSLPPADRDDMEVFLENLQILLPVLGFNFVLPKPSRSHSVQNNSSTIESEMPIFTITTREQQTGIEVHASGQQIDSEFVVLKDSQALLRDKSSSYSDIKKRLVSNGSLVRQGEIYVFIEDVPFSSPSGAAAVVRGYNTNGRTYWKLRDGTTYGDWLDNQLDVQSD